jgi:hypothetical protein
MATSQVTGLRLPEDVRRWLKYRAAIDDATMTEIVTNAIRKVMAGEAAEPLPRCAVCQMPRYPNHPDPMYDVMAHAQCDQIMAKLEESST